MSRKRPSRPHSADIELLATVQADKLRFDERPETEIRFFGEPGHESASGSDRTNLPDRVEARHHLSRCARRLPARQPPGRRRWWPVAGARRPLERPAAPGAGQAERDRRHSTFTPWVRWRGGRVGPPPAWQAWCPEAWAEQGSRPPRMHGRQPRRVPRLRRYPGLRRADSAVAGLTLTAWRRWTGPARAPRPGGGKRRDRIRSRLHRCRRRWT
jgi:hypothetical protein